MKRSTFIRNGFLTGAAALLFGNGHSAVRNKKGIRVRLLRHATLVVEINGKKILVDPMLSKKAALDPIANAANNIRIPMIDLTITDQELANIIKTTDAVLVTHTHRDHWDIAAQEKIPKDKLILCQPADEDKIKSHGFANVRSVQDSVLWNDIGIHRTNGQHGTGEVGKRMGTVAGFVLIHGKQRIYIAGDTIWCQDVKDAITKHNPAHIIVNGGGAQFIEGDPITMTVNDVLSVAEFTKARVSVVHLETINHCLQRRVDFRSMIDAQRLKTQISVPDDGEWLRI